MLTKRLLRNMSASATLPTRPTSRLRPLLDAAAREFAKHGYAATTTRAIAAAAEMTPGAIYSHFPSKQALLLAVYAEAVERTARAVDTAVEGEGVPWRRLERAVEAHLGAVVERDDYARVMTQVCPENVPEAAAALRDLRRDYERRFYVLVEALDIPERVDGGMLRLLLLGGINLSPLWFKPERGTVSDVARAFVAILRDGCAK